MTQSFIQLECLEFCNNYCFERFMYDDNFKCRSCGKFGQSIGPFVHIVGNRMHYFCNEVCQHTFFDLMKFCRFCRNVINSLNHSDGFCQPDCRIRFNQLYDNRVNVAKKPCCQCQSEKSVNILLRVDGVIHGFCSFACYFHLKTSYGLFPGRIFSSNFLTTLNC